MDKVMEHDGDFLAMHKKHMGPKGIAIPMKCTTRSVESRFGKAKKELDTYNANMKAAVLQAKIQLSDVEVQEIEDAMDRYWEGVIWFPKQEHICH